MTKKKKIILAAVAVVLIAGGLKVALGSRQAEPAGTPVTTGTVVRQDGRSSEAEGNIGRHRKCGSGFQTPL